MKSVKLKLRCGHFNIVNGKDMTANDPSFPFLIYTENDAGNLTVTSL